MIFENYGGIFQLRLETAEDLASLGKLKESRWAATSAPVGCFRCDPAVLKCLDSDETGRIRTEDLKDAQEWLFHFLSNREGATRHSDALRLDDLDTTHSEGRELQEACKWILGQLERQGSNEISLEQIRVFRTGYARVFPNGDGIVPLVDIEDESTRAFCADVVKYAGEVKDASGKIGYGKEQLQLFLDRARAMRDWMVEGKQTAAGEQRGSELWRWGDATPEATAIVFALEAKLEQFFWQCDLLRVEPRAASRFELSQDELVGFDLESARAIEKRLSTAPLSRPNAAGELNLRSGLNPCYEERVWELHDKVLKRALGTEAEKLTRKDWDKVKALFEPHKAWYDANPKDEIEALGEEKLTAYLEGELPKEAEVLIERDLAVRDELEQIATVEKLCLLQRWLLELANNFVNFSQLYDPNRRSLFEEGTLVIDGRELAFSMKVTNRSEHRKIAEMSRMFLIYAEITSKVATSSHREKFELVVAVTAGERGSISVGKRGVFFDVEAREWDARVVEVVENPISLWEAVKAPFQRIGGLAAHKLERIAARETESIEKATEAGLEKIDATPAGEGKPSAAAAPGQKTSVRDLLLGGGIAFAAVGSSLAFIVKTLSEVNPLHVGAVVLALGGIVMLSSGLLGYLKLRSRDMSALLEAAGWAVNFRMKLTRRLGRLFTRSGELPKDAVKRRRDLIDGFLAEIDVSPSRRGRILALIAVLLVVVLGVLAYLNPEALAELFTSPR
jgi:hypothetical protein